MRWIINRIMDHGCQFVYNAAHIVSHQTDFFQAQPQAHRKKEDGEVKNDHWWLEPGLEAKVEVPSESLRIWYNEVLFAGD